MRRYTYAPVNTIFDGTSTFRALTSGILNVVKTVSKFNRASSLYLSNKTYLTLHKGGSYKLEGKRLFVKLFRSTAGSCKNRVKKTKKYNKKN